MNQSVIVQPGTPLWGFIQQEWNGCTNEPMPSAAQQAADAFDAACEARTEPQTFDGLTQKEWAELLHQAWMNGVVLSADDFDFAGASVIERDWPRFRYAFLKYGRAELSYKLRFSVTPPKEWEQNSGANFDYEFDFDEKGELTTLGAPNFMSELFGDSALGGPEEIFGLLNTLAELPDSAWSDKALTLRATRSWVKQQEARK